MKAMHGFATAWNSMSPDEKLTFLIALGTWAAVLCALVAVWLQNRSAKRLTCLQLFLQLAAQYDSDEMQRRRAQLSKKLLQNPKTLDVEDTLLVFFENLALMSRLKLLDRRLVWNSFSVDVCSYWFALKHYVMHVRQVFKDDEFFCEFEELNKRLLRKQAPDSQVGMNQASVEQFLNWEALRWDQASQKTSLQTG